MLDFNEAPPQQPAENVHPLPFRPSADAMRLMVSTLFRAAPRGLIELAWTSDTAPHKLNSARLFGPEDIEDLVSRAAQLNETPNRNVYISAGLRREDADRDRRGTDDQVIALAAIKADFDAPGALDAAWSALKQRDMLPNMLVITGHHPHTRGQMWWVLDEPTGERQIVQEIERRLAVWLKGDKSITNPSRVMRLGGSVAWPLKAGRKLEVTQLITHSTRRAPWSLDEIKAAVREAVPHDALESAQPDNPLDFNTAARQGGQSVLERVNKALAGDRWHDNIRDAVAHMTRRGTPPDIIIDLLSPLAVRPGYTIEETRAEVAEMARGAIRKGYVKAEEAEPEGPKPHGLAGQWIDEIEYRYEPELVEGLIPAKGVGVIYGPSSAGKSFVTVDWAMRIAGSGKVLDRFTEASGVLYFAAEGQGGLRKRLVAARKAHGMDDVVLPFNYLPALLDLSRAETGDVERLCLYAEEAAIEMKARGAPLRVVVIDTLAAAAPSADENIQRDMGPIMLAFHRMANRLGAVILLVAHTGKDVARGLRGWSGIRANADFAIECRVDKDEDTGETTRRTLWLEKAKDGRDGFALSDYVLRISNLGAKRSGEPDTTCWVEYVPHQALPPKASAKPSTLYSGAQKRILQFLSEGGKTTIEVAGHLGLDRSNAGKKLRAMEKDGAIFSRNEGQRQIWLITGDVLPTDF